MKLKKYIKVMGDNGISHLRQCWKGTFREYKPQEYIKNEPLTITYYGVTATIKGNSSNGWVIFTLKEGYDIVDLQLHDEFFQREHKRILRWMSSDYRYIRNSYLYSEMVIDNCDITECIQRVLLRINEMRGNE